MLSLFSELREKVPNRTGVSIVVSVGLCLLLLGVFGTAVATHEPEQRAHVHVALESDGDATVSLVRTFDLTTEAEQAAFGSLEGDEPAKTAFRDRFGERMRSVANAAANETGRAMSVVNPTIELSRSDDGTTGIVVMTLSWSDLATGEDGGLVVTEPFASGFAPSYEFVITSPDGYRIADVSPEPDTRTDSAATWSAGTALDDFRVVFDEAPADQRGSRLPGQPGFGLLAALVGLSTVAWAIKRRG